MEKIKRKWVKALLITGIVLVSFVVAVIIFAACFLNLYKPFGGSITKADRADYEKRAENYRDGEFSNTGEFSILGSYEDKYSSRSTGKSDTPKQKLPTVSPEFIAQPSESEFSVTWLGHSTLMLQMQSMNILFDPVFGNRTSPVSFAGPKRFSDLPISVDELPHIDIVIISHDHYDHLDYDSIRELSGKVDSFIVPLGVEKHLQRWGVDKNKIRELAWWEETQVNGLTVACTPARHYSGRGLYDRNKTLWASWVLRNDYYSVFESGDTGYGDHFTQISERYGAFDLALLDCAQYNEKWHNIHMFPEESAQAAVELKASYVMPIHWGAFKLAEHSWDDAPERLVQRGEELGLKIVTPRLGETAEYGKFDEFAQRWWRDIK